MGSVDSKTDAFHQSMELFTAIYHNNWKEATRMIIEGTDINCINFDGRTPLMETCRSIHIEDGDEHEKFVAFLLDHDALVNMSDIYGCTARLYAKKMGFCSIALKLERKENRTSIIEKRVDWHIHAADLARESEDRYIEI